MKFTIDKTSLIKPLSHIQSIVERRNTIPILSNVVIKAQNGIISLSATDMDIDILENIECNVLEEGNATITAHILYEIVKNYDNDTCFIKPTGERKSLVFKTQISYSYQEVLPW